GSEGPGRPTPKGDRGRTQAIGREDRADRAPRRDDPWPAGAGQGDRGGEYLSRTRGEESAQGPRRRAEGNPRGTPGPEEEQGRDGGRGGRDGEGGEEARGPRHEGGDAQQGGGGGRVPRRVHRRPTLGTCGA